MLTDLRLLAAMARYHAARFRSGTEYVLFRTTLCRSALRNAIAQFEQAVAHWRSAVELTDGVYYDHMVFNKPPDQIGHWKDELPFLDRELNRLREIDELYGRYADNPAKAEELCVAEQWIEIPMEWKEENGVLRRWAGEDVPASPPNYPPKFKIKHPYVMETPESVIRSAFKDLYSPRLVWVPVRFTVEGAETTVRSSLLGWRGHGSMTLHWQLEGRPESETRISMHTEGDGVFEAALPPLGTGERLIYFLEAEADEIGIQMRTAAITLTCGGGAQRPVIRSDDIAGCRAGEDLEIRAAVVFCARPARVQLHYRRMHQAEDWSTVDMRSGKKGEYVGVIPGAAIDPDWDLMYAVSAIDEAGGEAFYPDLDERAPYVVVAVK